MEQRAERRSRMPLGSWGRLVRQKRQTAVYRITLLVRGREITREFEREDDYRKWKTAYEEQEQNKEQSGVEIIRAGIVYR